MERAKRLTTLWSYLPVFRVVAETEHISRAAKRLFVTPSAVSRTLAALEADIGQPLFDRHGRSMKLNQAGQHLLLGVRTSMRVVDESLAAISGETLVGKVRVATCEPFSSMLLPRLTVELAVRHPSLVPSIVRVPEGEAVDALLDGRLDVAFVRGFAPRPQIRSAVLGRFATAAFAAADHPIVERGVAACAPSSVRYVEVGSPGACHASAWAAEVALRPSLTVADFDLALTAVEAGHAVAVLPEVMAVAGVRRGTLRRLAVVLPPEVTIVGLTRSPHERPGRADVILELAKSIATDRVQEAR